MMLASAEVRWFFSGDLPADVLRWFRRGDLWAAQPERTDAYLLLPGCDTVGVKLREGRFEVKARTAAPRAVHYPGGVSGHCDAWVKWSREAGSAENLRRFLGDDGERWLEVRKRRFLRGFAVPGDPASHEPREVRIGDVRPPRGCGVEITEVSVAEPEPSRWWTLGLEAFDDDGDPGPCLEAVAQAFFDAAPPPLELGLEASRSYAAWLLGLTTR